MRRALLALAIFLAAAGPAMASCLPPKDFPNPDLLGAMQRGVNLPGWDEDEIARRPTPAQLRATRDAGLTHIRLPIDARPFDRGGGKGYVDRIEEQVVLLLSLDFAVSLDLHAGGETGRRFGRDVDGATAYLLPIWQEIATMARRFDPARVAVELLNEPEFSQDDWMTIAERLRRELRGILPDHTLVVGPSGPQRHETLSDMQPLADRNVVYAVHYYDPFPFTHQGATWGAADDPLRQLKGLPFPAARSMPVIVEAEAELERQQADAAADLLRRTLERPWDGDMIAAAYDTMHEWSARHDAPVIVNEFGVLSFTAPRASRLRWLNQTAAAAEARCIGWTHWDFQDGFGLVDSATAMPDREIIEALIPDQSGR